MGDRICGECEFFGKYQSIILSQFKECVADGRVTYTRDFLGFDKKMGASCDNKDHRPTNVRVYEETPACKLFQRRNWDRPLACNECSLLNYIDQDGFVHCTGYPFFQRFGTEPCQNGKCLEGENLRLF